MSEPSVITLARRQAPTVVNTARTVDHTLGEYDLIPAYQFTAPATALPVDLTDFTSLDCIVMGQRLEPALSDPFQAPATITSPTTGVVALTAPPSDTSDGSTLYADEMAHAGQYEVRYRIGNTPGPYLFSDPITVQIHDHGPGPLSTLGGVLA